jgi:hypothetical protein
MLVAVVYAAFSVIGYHDKLIITCSWPGKGKKAE